ncbi:MAG: leucine-rich repeat protein [Acutalibacteraceae bacterium]
MKKIRTKKLFAFLLSAAMVISMLCIAPVSVSAETSGDYEYTVLDDGTAEITKYSGTESTLTIPTELDGKKVSSIGKFSFEKNTSITSLTIPAGISIGNNAFRYCKLSSLKLSDGVTTIGNGAFSFCEGLTELVLPDSVTTLGDYAFQGCRKLKSVKLPNKLEKINDFAFATCEALTSIEFPSSVKEIGQSSFTHCYGLTSVVIPGTVKLINTGALSYCENLTSVTLNEGIETVSAFAFSNCLKLMEITVPDSVTEINRLAFGYWFDQSVWNDVPVKGFVLKGHTGSAAEAYAKESGVTFESIGITQQPTTEATTAAPTEPPEPGTVVTVYFKNTSNFSAPYAYYWPNGGKGPISWPGVAMTKVTDDVYKVDVPAENNMIIFSDNGNNKIGDLEMGADNQIYDGGWKDYEDAPTEPTPGVTEPTTDATEPTTNTTEPTTEATEPTTEVTEPTTEATEPTTNATEPTTEATEPTTEATEPTTEVTEPTTGATEPTTQATEPTTEPESELSDKLYGDVNGDGKVNVKDVTEIQRAAASIITLSDLQKAVADVNGDGNVNIKDATDIQKFAASLTVANVGEKVPTALLPKEA